MKQKIYDLINNYDNFKKEITKINNESYREISDNVSVGIDINRQTIVFKSHYKKTNKGFTTHIPYQQVANLITHLKELLEYF